MTFILAELTGFQGNIVNRLLAQVQVVFTF